MPSKIRRMQIEYEKRLAKQRRNRKNWTSNIEYSIKKTPEFKIKHGKYIKGED